MQFTMVTLKKLPKQFTIIGMNNYRKFQISMQITLFITIKQENQSSATILAYEFKSNMVLIN